MPGNSRPQGNRALFCGGAPWRALHSCSFARSRKAYAESSSTTPIAFILGETADPCEGIYELAEKLNVSAKRLQFLCLGEGRETQAEELLREGIQAGTWVILMNCHLLPDWLAKLESACEAFDEETAN